MKESNYEDRGGVRDRTHKTWRPSEEIYQSVKQQFPEGFSDNKILNQIVSEWLADKEVRVTLRMSASTLFNVNKLFPSQDSSKSIRKALDYACHMKEYSFDDLKL